MWPFKKRKIVDLTRDFEKSKIPKEVEDRIKNKLKKEDYVDVSSTSGENALGFLGNMASSSSASKTSLEFKDIKRKIDDFEFKLDSVNRRIDSILDRLDVAERKLNRG